MPKHSGKKKANEHARSGHISNSSDVTPREPVEMVQHHAPYEIPPGNIIIEQNQEMREQDAQLLDLEASITNLRDASLVINQEVSLQNRLLDDVHVRVDSVQGQQLGTQQRLRNFMRRSGTCKSWLFIAGLVLILIVLLIIFK